MTKLFYLCFITRFPYMYSLFLVPRIFDCLPSLQQHCFASFSSTVYTSKTSSLPHDIFVCEHRHKSADLLLNLNKLTDLQVLFSTVQQIRFSPKLLIIALENFHHQRTSVLLCQKTLLPLFSTLFEAHFAFILYRNTELT